MTEAGADQDVRETGEVQIAAVRSGGVLDADPGQDRDLVMAFVER
jgi:hypothetical protein